MEQTFTFNLNVRSWQATFSHCLRLADARYYAQEATRLSLAAMLNGTVESLTLPHVIPPVRIGCAAIDRLWSFYSLPNALCCLQILRLASSNEVVALPSSTARSEHPQWTNCTLGSQTQPGSRQFWTLACPVGTLYKAAGVDPQTIGPSFYTLSAKATFGAFLLGTGACHARCCPHWPRCNMFRAYQGPLSDFTSLSLFLLVASCAYSWSESRYRAVLHLRVNTLVSAHVDLHSATSSMTTCGTVALSSIAVWYVDRRLFDSHASAYIPA